MPFKNVLLYYTIFLKMKKKIVTNKQNKFHGEQVPPSKFDLIPNSFDEFREWNYVLQMRGG